MESDTGALAQELIWNMGHEGTDWRFPFDSPESEVISLILRISGNHLNIISYNNILLQQTEIRHQMKMMEIEPGKLIA